MRNLLLQSATLAATIAVSLASTALAQERQRGGIATVLDLYAEQCAVCHGPQLEGAAQGTPLHRDVTLSRGDSVEALMTSISTGAPDKGMPAWGNVMSADDIKSLALLIAEVRSGNTYDTFNYTHEITYSDQPVKTAQATYYLFPVNQDIDRLPYSIAPMPDGSILVTEKMQGLRIIAPDGSKSALIEGTPAVYADTRASRIGLEYGSGWLLDVALHPDYEDNGWIYLHHTDRCNDCNQVARQAGRPVSMNRLIRGRIRDNKWVDEEIIWQPDMASYAPGSDVAAGGRITFDPEGFVYLSTGMKSRDGMQSLSSPHGKILRLHDDGAIPTDNPFVGVEGALPEIWTYGHRSPQGLEFNHITGQLWGTEHGPRGGDEINLLLPGENYGWPLFSKGQNYDGSEVAWGRETSEVTLDDIQQPVVDMTPSPAISSFVIYDGEAFPQWRGQMLVGSLKAMDLYRVQVQQLEDGTFTHTRELIVEDLARIRDIEVAANGDVLLLLEHNAGSQIARLTPHSQQVDNSEPLLGRVTSTSN